MSENHLETRQMTQEEYSNIPTYFNNVENVQIGKLYRARDGKPPFIVELQRNGTGLKLQGIEVSIIETSSAGECL